MAKEEKLEINRETLQGEETIKNYDQYFQRGKKIFAIVK